MRKIFFGRNIFCKILFFSTLEFDYPRRYSMKILRFAVAAVVVSSVAAFATNARVESMGKRSTFIMDDISIFDNPANINLYPNFLIGELGVYTGAETDSVKTGQNHDPMEPWFGGIFSLDIGANSSLSIAGVLNRKEQRLLKFFPEKIGTLSSNVETPEPVTNFDGFLGGNFNNKAFGLHIYIAHQDGITRDENKTIMTSDAFASALQLDAGVNIEVSNDLSLEVAGGAARIQYGPDDRDFLDQDLLSFFGNIRLFSKIQAINGHLIPVASIRDMNAPGRSEFEVMGGMGVDAAFDRGFFWLGLEGFFNNQKANACWKKFDKNVYFAENANSDWETDKKDWARLWMIGGTISFGIERNIWWDWFVIRVGGQKTIAYADFKGSNSKTSSNFLCPSENCNANPEIVSGNFFVTNPVNDGTRNDNVGFGFGINIEEKLKIDATVAEDVVFRNPFQGEGRLISRVSATYSF
jgi:hypothetical protein